MTEYLFKLLLNRGSSFILKLGVVLGLLISVCLIDYFTSYPSLAMIKDKYETIEKISLVLNDNRASEEIKTIARADLQDIQHRHSIAYRASSLLQNFNTVFANVSKRVANEIASPIKNVTGWTLFFVGSNALWLLVALFNGPGFYREDRKNFKYFILILMVLVLSNSFLSLLSAAIFDPTIPKTIGIVTHICLVTLFTFYAKVKEMKSHAEMEMKAAMAAAEVAEAALKQTSRD